jgi:hypothetical protein
MLDKLHLPTNAVLYYVWEWEGEKRVVVKPFLTEMAADTFADTDPSYKVARVETTVRVTR